MNSLICGFKTFFKDESKIDVRDWYEIYKMVYGNVIHIDRFGDTIFPYNFVCKPELKLSINDHKKTYDECCLNRATELLDFSKQNNQKIGILYSGGIDSTAILSSFFQVMNEYDLKNNLVIFMNRDSISENPNFYHSKIKNKCVVKSSEQFSSILNNPKYHIIDGEHNDQLFGADLILYLVRDFGFNFLKQPCTRENILKCLYRVKMSEHAANKWFDILSKSALEAPAPIETVYDFFWWINFNFKWQSVFFRMPIRCLQNSNRLKINIDQIKRQHFFSSDDFQNWSIFNGDKKIQNSWNTYKFAAKQFINNFYRDDEYFNYKLKMPSLSYLFFTNIVPSAVTSDFIPLFNLNKSDFYNQQNSFR